MNDPLSLPFQMDILECVPFFYEMSDFEFERTFRFTNDAVRHLTALLSNTTWQLVVIFYAEHPPPPQQ